MEESWQFFALRATTYAFKLNDENDDTVKKKAKGTKKCIVKIEITFKNYADALFNDFVIIRSQQRFRSDHHRVYTEEVNKITLSSNDDKMIQTLIKSQRFPMGQMHLKCARMKCCLKRSNTVSKKNKKWTCQELNVIEQTMMNRRNSQIIILI